MFTRFIQMKNQGIALLLALMVAMPSLANTQEQARKVEGQIISQAKASQQRIDASSDEALKVAAEIQALEREVEQLKVYRQHLSAMVDSQQQEVASYHVQLEQIDSTRLGVVPLMYQMLAGLEQQLANDMPIRAEVRQQRFTQLSALMTQADVSEAEKYRRLLEAYQIELDYGLKLGSYQGAMQLPTGQVIQAEQLNMGRAALIARSLDQQQYWSWDGSAQSWTEMDSAQQIKAKQAFDVANKVVAPSLLELPLSLTEELQ